MSAGYTSIEHATWIFQVSVKKPIIYMTYLVHIILVHVQFFVL